MSHELIQRIYRLKNILLVSMVQINPVRSRGIKGAICHSNDIQMKDLENVRAKIVIYESNPKKYKSLDEINLP